LYLSLLLSPSLLGHLGNSLLEQSRLVISKESIGFSGSKTFKNINFENYTKMYNFFKKLTYNFFINIKND
jgi:hypothetical protein